MNLPLKLTARIILATAGLLAAHSAEASIQVAFDTANSNIGAGIYAFDLLNVPTSPIPTYNSVFDFTGLANVAAGGVDNALDPVVSMSAPTGWNYDVTTLNVAEWYFENTAGVVNGIFEIKMTPNLSGTFNWQLAVPGINADTTSGTVVIAVPEPGQYGKIGGLAAFSLVTFSACRRSRQSARTGR
jgi:hypothetical protein